MSQKRWLSIGLSLLTSVIGGLITGASFYVGAGRQLREAVSGALMWRLAPVLLLLAACGEQEVNTREQIAGEYVQMEHNGKRLPVTENVVSSAPNQECIYRLVRSTLRINPDGTYSHERDQTNGCREEGGSMETDRVLGEEVGRYELRGARGDTIVFSPVTHIVRIGGEESFDARDEAENAGVRVATIKGEWIETYATSDGKRVPGAKLKKVSRN